jgi:hypothetical protein
MSGTSIGWFETTALYPDPEGLIRAIAGMLAPRLRRQRAWPLAVSSIRAEGKGVGVAYALIGGHIPIHRDTVGLDDSDGRIFQFVLTTDNRPLLLVAPGAGTTDLIYQGIAPPSVPQTVALGGVELKPGMAVHFDITENWHGIGAMPMPMESLQDDLTPRAIIVQVAGFAAEQIGMALEHAAYWIARDVGASSLAR